MTMAAEEGHLDIVVYLVYKGADISIKDIMEVSNTRGREGGKMRIFLSMKVCISVVYKQPCFILH